MAEERKKILLVEDEMNVSRLFSFVLEKEGFEVKVAENGFVALKKLNSFTPDLILSDIMMPILDGYEFRKKLLEDSAMAAIPFVFLSAKGTEDDMLKGYDLEIQDYIIKTSTPKVVTKKINAIFSAQQKEREKAAEEVSKAAGSIGSALVPDRPIDAEGFEIEQWYQPYKKVPGGDFIDYYKLDENRTLIALGDVMGKKWGAWYFAVAYAGYVRSAVRMALQSTRNATASEIMQRINSAVYEDDRISDVFVTLSIVVLNNSTKTLTYSGAGDLPIVHVSNSVNYLKSDGLLLGFKSNGDYSDISADLKTGELVLMYTDGISESRNAEGEAFGSGKLKDAIAEAAKLPHPMRHLKEEFTKFTDGNFEDDISLITISVK